MALNNNRAKNNSVKNFLELIDHYCGLFLHAIELIMRHRRFEQYFWLNKFLIKSCGIMPLNTKNSVINLFFALIPFIMCGFLAIPAVYSMTAGWRYLNSEERANIFSDHVELIAAAIKVMALLTKRQKIAKLAEMCSKTWISVEDENDYRPISIFADMALYITYGFTFNVLFALVSILLAPMIPESTLNISNNTVIALKQLPYSTGYFHDVVNYFYFWYLLQIVAGFICVIQILAPDTAFVFFTLHGCANARLCQSSYRKIKSSLKNLDEKSGENYKKNMLIECIEQHKRLLEYCQIVEDTFTIIVLIQMLLSVSTICIFGFNLLLQNGEQVKYVVHLTGAVIQLSLFCWPAHNLQIETAAIANIAYDLPWYSWSVNNRKVVLIIITRSQKFARITVGKFNIASIETFSSTLSTALSFFTVLRQVV